MAITSVTGFSEPFVQTSPFYDRTYVSVYRRTARDSAGTGSSAVGQVVTQLRLSQLTDFSFPYRFGGRFYLGFATVARTGTASGVGTSTATGLRSKSSVATGSGVGSSSVSSVRIPVRTASASGAGGSSAVSLKVAIRTASASGVGTSSVVRLVTVVRDGAASAGTGSATVSQVLSNNRTATATGVGSSSVATLVTRLRSASGEGLGTSSATRVLVGIRTATGSGTGTATTLSGVLYIRNASGSGSSSGSADWVKSHIFRVPYTYNYPGGYFGGGDSANRLGRYDRSGVRARNLYKLKTGEYTIVDQRDLGQVEKLWHGGRLHFLDDAEVAELTAAGFGDSIT